MTSAVGDEQELGQRDWRAVVRRRRGAVIVLAMVFLGWATFLLLGGGVARAVADGSSSAESAGVYFSLVAGFFVLIAFAIVSAILIVTDFEIHRLPNRVLLVSGVAMSTAVILAGLMSGEVWPVARFFACGLVVGGVLFALALMPGSGIGGGDIKLSAMVAAVTGWIAVELAGVALVIAFACAGVVAIVLLMRRQASRSTPIAFGPYLIIGAWVALSLGRLS